MSLTTLGDAIATSRNIVMRRIAAFLAALAAISPAVQAGEPTSAKVNVSWAVTLDPSGRVVQITTDDKSVPKLHRQLEAAIRGWHFSPGKVNDVPAETLTNLVTKIEIKIANEAFEVRVLDATTGSRISRTTPPRYPPGAAREHAQGTVRVLVNFDADGKVASATPYETTVEKTEQPDKRLVEAAIEAVKKWTMAPEVVGGHPVAGQVVVPIAFCLGRESRACETKDEATGKTVDADETVALNPAATLLSDVVGHTL